MSGILELTREVLGVGALGTSCSSAGSGFGIGGRLARCHSWFGGILAHLNQGIKSIK